MTMQLAATAFKPDDSGTVLALHIQPGAKRSAVCGMYGDAVKIAVKAPPVDGKANSALREFLAEKLGVPNGAVQLITGATGRDKRLHIAGKSPEEVRIALENDQRGMTKRILTGT